MLIEKIVGMMLSEDLKTITRFLGYEPDMEVFNNNQLLETEIRNVAEQMPEDILLQFYEEVDKKTRDEAERRYNLQLVEDLLSSMEDYKNKINNHLMSEIVERIDTAITDIECLKCDLEQS